MTEKNILAYFKSPEEAEGVQRKLNALRVSEVSIDRFSRYPGPAYDLSTLAVGTLSNLGSMAQQSNIAITSGDILSAADPANSGMSHGGGGGPTAHAILLTAVVDEEVHHQALKLIEEAGGIV